MKSAKRSFSSVMAKKGPCLSSVARTPGKRLAETTSPKKVMKVVRQFILGNPSEPPKLQAMHSNQHSASCNSFCDWKTQFTGQILCQGIFCWNSNPGL